MVKYYYIDDYLYCISTLRSQIYKRGSEFFSMESRGNPSYIMPKPVHEKLEEFRQFSEILHSLSQAFFNLKAEYLKAGKTEDECLGGESLTNFHGLVAGFDTLKTEIKEFFSTIETKEN